MMSSFDSAADMEESKSATPYNETEFVDYVPTPEVPVLPPAKYKLWLIIYILVYFAAWVSAEAGFREFLEFGGWLSFNASLFLSLGITVFVLVYAAVDLFQEGMTWETKDGTAHGVIAWLKGPRATWVHRGDSLFYDIAARVVHILEEGFDMFNAPPLTNAGDGPQQFHCADGSCATMLKIEHRIKPDRLSDYKKWVRRIQRAVEDTPGVECAKAEEIREERDEEEGKVKPEADLATVYVRFDNIDYLNDWMLSVRRKALMKQLEPLLVQPDVIQIEKDRALPDAFSDLLTRQGSSVPKSPPRKWKVAWLTLLALYVTIHWSNSFFPHYHDQWRFDKMDHRLASGVDLLIVTFLTSYVTTPLFLFLFDHWVQHDTVQNTRQPWATFDYGLQSFWMKVALTVAFYGGCIIVIVMKKHQR